MHDDDLVNLNTTLHLQPFELGRSGARLMVQKINTLLELKRCTAEFGYALFLFSRGQKEAMIFFFTNSQRCDMVRVLKEFIRIQEDA